MAVVTRKTKPLGRGKWMVLGVLGLAGFIAVETGWAGFGFAQLRSAVYPTDTGLLGWVPGDTGAVVIVDPHQLHLDALGAEGTVVRAAVERTRDDVKEATGVDLAFDVDKLLLSPSLAVAHGRFNQKKLTERLTEHRYALAEHKGETYLARAGEDAIAVVDGSVLLYGDEASIKAAIDAHQGDTSLEKSAEVKARLAQVGWNHPLLVTVRITDDKPSLRAILTGGTGPRAVTVGVATLGGLDADAIVEAASPSAAAELQKLLEEKRKDVAALTPMVGAEVVPVLTDVAKKATLTTDPKTGILKIHAHVDPAQLDTLARNARASLPLAEMYKTMRLFQLLAPGG
jgi:hypothetical protein